MSGLAGKYAWRMRPYIPLTALNTVWRLLDKGAKTILDVGCGKGEPMKFINRKGLFKVVGVDIFQPYLIGCRELSAYSECVRCDIRVLPFKRRSFDVVICMAVLEHLVKNDGIRLIKNLESIARKQIIIDAPKGVYEQHNAKDGNPAQIHKSSWCPDDLKKLGYRVRGQRLPIYGESGLVAHVPQVRYDIIKMSNLGWRPGYSSDEAVKQAIKDVLPNNFEGDD